MSDYRMLADAVAAEIATGVIAPGARLPTQRAFAYSRGIAVSTAGRIYAELARRGLVAGEVGRGTFVLDRRARPDPALVEPTALPIDLEMVFSMPPGCEDLLAESFRRWAASPAFSSALNPVGASGTRDQRRIAAEYLTRSRWMPDPSAVLFAGNGKQAIAAALSVLARPGDRVGVEAMTYPVVKAIAARLGLTLVPLPMDGEGLIPDAFEEIHRSKPLSTVYMQPTLQNPLGYTMGADRRAAWARALDQTGLIAIEDGIYSFLAPEPPPLTELAPERVIYLDSLSKRISPGASLGLLVAPASLVSPLASAIRAGAWSASGLSMAVGSHWMISEEVAIVTERKRADAKSRQLMARDILGQAGLQSDSRAFHAWLPMPDAVRAETFVTHALRRGIAVSAGSVFAVGSGYAPAGVRLAFGAPPLARLTEALRSLRALMENPTDDLVE